MDLLRRFASFVEDFSELEPLVPRMREAQKAVEADESLEYKAHKGLVTGELAELGTLWGRKSTLFMVTPASGFRRALDAGAGELFLAILQHYDVPTKVRRVVERAAKFFAKSKVRRSKRAEAVETYVQALKTYRSFLEAASQALSEGALHGEGSGTKLPAGKFTVVNTGGFPDDTMETVVETVTRASQLVTAKGLGKICYGDILVANTVGRSSRVLAFYRIPDDELFVRANLKGQKGAALRTIIHELAHRLHFRFLKSQDGEIQGIYRRLMGDDEELLQAAAKDPANRPQPGDTLVSKGKTYEVTGLGFRRGLTVELRRQDDPKATASVSMPGWLTMKGYVPDSGAFVSVYAKKDHEENFAEMVSHYVLGTLPDDQVEMLERVLP